MSRIEVLDINVCHPGIERQAFHELGDSLHPARRCSDGYNRE